MKYMKLIIGLGFIVLGVFVGSFISLGGYGGAFLGGWLGAMLYCIFFWPARRWPV